MQKSAAKVVLLLQRFTPDDDGKGQTWRGADWQQCRMAKIGKIFLNVSISSP
jgi:hypothetical protein